MNKEKIAILDTFISGLTDLRERFEALEHGSKEELWFLFGSEG